MNFLMTFYIYPLSEEIVLSHHLSFNLDNPRTDEEISIVKDYLLKAYDSEGDEQIPIHSNEPIETLENILLDFQEEFSGSDEYIARFFHSYERDKIFEFIAKMWVIARFDDEGEIQLINEGLRQREAQGLSSVVWLDNDHPIVHNSERLVSYSYLLSLLTHSEGSDYFGRSFILDPHQITRFQPVKSLWIDFFMFATGVKGGRDVLAELEWIFLPFALDNLRENIGLLDKAFRDGLTEKLLYIGGILKIVSHDVRDVKVALVMLTSIIELLVTHSPNTNRFNVEDSISKQFQLKASILIYLNDKSKGINDIKRRLKTIYEQRSNVAHGNLGEIHRYVSKLSKKEGEEEYFEDLKSDLYKYIRAILEEYLKDRPFVDFLKDS